MNPDACGGIAKDRIITHYDKEKDITVTAKKSCKRCFGRGFVGINVLNNTMVVCSCTEFSQPKKEKKNDTEKNS